MTSNTDCWFSFQNIICRHKFSSIAHKKKKLISIFKQVNSLDHVLIRHCTSCPNEVNVIQAHRRTVNTGPVALIGALLFSAQHLDDRGAKKYTFNGTRDGGQR